MGDNSAADPLYAALREVFAEVFPGRDIVLTPELSAPQVKGWDSMAQVQILLAIEERFDIEFAPAEISRTRNVGEFIELIRSKVGSA